MIDDPGPPRPPTGPVTLTEATRADRAVLGNLGQLFRYDMSEAYLQLPNADGTFNDRQLDTFRTGADPGRRAWLIHVADRLAGFAHVRPWGQGGTSITGFLVVRALRRTGVGRTAAGLLLAEVPGRWGFAYQRINRGAGPFWEQVATDAVGARWTSHDEPPLPDRPVDTWITFDTSGAAAC